MNAPIHLWGASPYQSAQAQYTSKGWAVLPLPAKRKKSPPGKDDAPQMESFTGRQGRLPTEEDHEVWRDQDRWRNGNICVRPGNVITHEGKDYELLGLDVDNYDEKTGLAHLRELEKAYGPLPSTFTSSARTDGASGIRWFLVPAGYEYMGKPRMADGKASDSIEVVQKVHRYGVVFPSIHPSGLQYRWYPRGQGPDGVNFVDAIPRVEEMALLPQRWWEFLSRNGIAALEAGQIDMDSTDKEIRVWAKRRLTDGDTACQATVKAIDKHLEDIANASDHHDPLVRSHWHLFRLAAEGHTGWASAVAVIESEWVDRVGKDQSRSLLEAKHEMRRSRYGALRKIKGEYDSYKAQGVQYLESDDPCEGKGHVDPPRTTRTSTAAPLPNSTSYERNEDGNAQHFLDLYPGKFRFVVNHPDGQGRWLYFSDKDKRWHVDTKDTMVRYLFRQVKERQQRDARVLKQNALAAIMAAGSPVPKPLTEDLADAKAWVQFGLESGNKTRVANSLMQATANRGVSVLFEELDQDLMVLPVANGLIRFHTKEEQLAGAPAFELSEDVEGLKDSLITQNTHVPYIPLKDQRTHADPEVRESYKLFTEYMKLFLRDQMRPESFRYVLRILGLSILGVNIKKAIFLVGKRDTGKSTFQSMMAKALGDLAIWRDPDIFIDSPFKGSLAEALSRRVCMVGELGEKHMDASLFKRITGGDEVSCQLKNINRPVTLKARCTVISGCNSAPEVPGVDDATKERFVVIPFRHQVSREDRDPSAQERLMEACRIPLLAMLVEECGRAIVEGVNEVPEELRMETENFVSSLSELGDFIASHLEFVPPETMAKYARKDRDDPRDPKPRIPDELTVGRKELYDMYCDWARLNNIKVESSNWFTRRMRDANLDDDGSKNAEKKDRWIGVRAKGMGRVMKG